MKSVGLNNVNKLQQLQKAHVFAPATAAPRPKTSTVVAAAGQDSDLGSSLAAGVRQIRAASTTVEAPTVQPVPGVEILPQVSLSPPPPPPSQGMDFVLEKLASQQQAGGDALSSASSSALGAVGSLNDAAGQAAAQASAAAADAANALNSAVGGSVSVAADAVGASAAAASAAAGEAASQLQSILDNIANEYSNETAIIKENLNSLTSGLQSTAASTFSGVQTQVDAQVASVLNQLPPEARDAIYAASSQAGHFVQKAIADPQFGATATGLGVGLPALLLYLASVGGFAGTLSIEKAEKVLQTEDALLVDVRTEARRLEGGMPELKRGARGKGAALAPVQLPPSISRRVRNSDALALEILGAQIAALARLNPRTKVIIMDEQGTKAKAIARAASAAGVRRAYVLQGGFRAWTGAGYGVLAGKTQFDDSPLGAVSDVAESVVEEAAVLVKDPRNLLIGGGAAFGLALLVFNYHLVFRFLGVVGLELTLLIRFLDYESPQDALDDVSVLYNTVASLIPASATQQGNDDSEQQQQQLAEQVSAE